MNDTWAYSLEKKQNFNWLEKKHLSCRNIEVKVFARSSGKGAILHLKLDLNSWLSYSLNFLTFYVELHTCLGISLRLHSRHMLFSYASSAYVNDFIFSKSM